MLLVAVQFVSGSRVCGGVCRFREASCNVNGTPAEGDKGILEQPLLDSALPEQSAQGPIGCEQRARPQLSHRDRWASAPVGMRAMASQPAMIALGDSFCGTLGGT